jgi:hypothetical protein
MFATNPEMAREFAAHTDFNKLPERKRKGPVRKPPDDPQGSRTVKVSLWTLFPPSLAEVVKAAMVGGGLRPPQAALAPQPLRPAVSPPLAAAPPTPPVPPVPPTPMPLRPIAMGMFSGGPGRKPMPRKTPALPGTPGHMATNVIDGKGGLDPRGLTIDGNNASGISKGA